MTKSVTSKHRYLQFFLYSFIFQKTNNLACTENKELGMHSKQRTRHAQKTKNTASTENKELGMHRKQRTRQAQKTKN
jgi:hypothetical protein